MQVVASGVSGWKHGAAEVPGQDAEQQLSQVFVLLEHVSAKKTRRQKRSLDPSERLWREDGSCLWFLQTL